MKARTVLCTLFLVSIGTADAQEGGVEVLAGGTLYDQGIRVSASYIYKRKGHMYRGSDRIKDPMDRKIDEHRWVAGVDYGVLPQLTASLLVPIVYRTQRLRSGNSHQTLHAFGLGDVALLGKYRIYKTDWEQSSFNLSVIAGMEFPTGRTDSREDGVRLAPSMQAGSGSWDPFFAIAANLSLNRLRFDAHIFFKLNTEGTQEFEDGNFLAFEFDFAYRFLHTKYPGPTAQARIGMQWRHKERSKSHGHKVSNSGSEEIWLRLTLGCHPIPRIDLSVSLDIPVFRKVQGNQIVLDLRLVVAFGFRF